MTQLDMKVNLIRYELDKVSGCLAELVSNGFSGTLDKLKLSMEGIFKMKEDIRKRYTRKELEKYDNELTFLAKQIEKKFDYIIQNIKDEQELISMELKKYQNKKKLAKYNR